MTRIRRFTIGAAILAVIAVVTACTPSDERRHVSVRLWDSQVAEAYRVSFAEFEKRNPGIEVEVTVIPWADYWTTLRTDLATDTVDDIFWTNAANYRAYAEAGLLQDIDTLLGIEASAAWQPEVVAQYTSAGSLWGVPQLTDPGIAILYNADAIAEGGVSVAELSALSWEPTADSDPLRDVATRLTVDAAGKHPGEPGFDASRTERFGYSASNDLNAIILQFLGSNGAAWQDGDEFVFDSPEGRQSIGYLVDLIGAGVAPPASDTNPPTGNDAALALFLRGKLALFQTGAYNLANVQENAAFSWGVAPLPRGPAGAVSVTNGVVASGWTGTDEPEAQKLVLEWLGSAEGSAAIGADGSALPAVISAQQSFLDYWSNQGQDLSPMLDVLTGGTIQAPQGANYAAAQQAYQPLFNEVFLGRVPVDEGLREAQRQSNEAMG